MDIIFLIPESDGASSDSGLTNSNDISDENKVDAEVSSEDKREYTLLDLYSGCGGMSTGLCMGASLSSVKLVSVRSNILIFLCTVNWKDRVR